MILTERHRNKRAQIIEQFIKVAQKCRELNNFNSLAWILSALEHEPVLRLRKTWEVRGFSLSLPLFSLRLHPLLIRLHT